MNMRMRPSCRFPKVRALPDGRANAPSAMMAILMLTLVGFVQSANSQIPRTDTKPKRFITRSPARKKTEGKQPVNSSSPNLAKEPTLYVVGYAHLDTELRWEDPQVISD